jgi:hypothetical protein
MKVLEPDDETIIVPINKRTHRVYLRDETESAVNVYIEPLTLDVLPSTPYADKVNNVVSDTEGLGDADVAFT